METKIRHQGVVLSAFRGTVTVAVESSEACGGCASKSACSLGVQSNTRNILVYTPDFQSYSVGESVIVSAKTSLGLMAVLLCYALPAVVLVGALAAMVTCGLGEGLSALLSLAAVALYYGVLWLFRDKMARKVSFSIEKL